jgi:hypothetical protein
MNISALAGIIKKTFLATTGEPVAATLMRRGTTSSIDSFTSHAVTAYTGHKNTSIGSDGAGVKITEVRIIDETQSVPTPRDLDKLVMGSRTYSIMTCEEFRIPGFWICGVEDSGTFT